MQTCDEAFKIYHIFSINGLLENEVAVSFMSQMDIRLTSRENRILLQTDANLYVVPNQFLQLVNIFLQYKSYSLPTTCC